MFTLNVSVFCIILLINLLLILFSDKSIILLLGKSLLFFGFYIPKIYHKAPTNKNSIAQRTEDEISASPRVDTQSTLSVGGGIQGLISGSRALFVCPQALPSCPVNPV